LALDSLMFHTMELRCFQIQLSLGKFPQKPKRSNCIIRLLTIVMAMAVLQRDDGVSQGGQN